MVWGVANRSGLQQGRGPIANAPGFGPRVPSGWVSMAGDG